MGCGASAASQRQKGGASEPRRTRHPWEGYCRVPAVPAGTRSNQTTYEPLILTSIGPLLASTFVISIG
jgi:hypothetical protein